MKLRQIALSIATASALAAAAPSFGQSDVGTSPSALPPLSEPSTSITTTPPTASPPDVVIVTPGTVTTTPDVVTAPGYVYDSNRTAIVTEQGGMTPQERRDTAGTADRATGAVTAPGYMGPHDSKGQ